MGQLKKQILHPQGYPFDCVADTLSFEQCSYWNIGTIDLSRYNVKMNYCTIAPLDSIMFSAWSRFSISNSILSKATIYNPYSDPIKGGYFSFCLMDSSIGYASSCVFGDPKLDFHSDYIGLLPNSPCRGAGQNGSDIGAPYQMFQ